MLRGRNIVDNRHGKYQFWLIFLIPLSNVVLKSLSQKVITIKTSSEAV